MFQLFLSGVDFYLAVSEMVCAGCCQRKTQLLLVTEQGTFQFFYSLRQFF
jgi:hypothetical protein